MNLLPESYTFEHRKVQKSDQLVITCSPTRNAAFYGSVFGCDVFYLCDFSGHYFTEEADVIATSLSNFLRQNDYKRIVMIGFSKSAFGALLLAQLISKINSECIFSVLCFSPQVLVYPRTTTLSFPSYQILIDKAEQSPRLMDGLKRFGKLAPFSQNSVFVKAYCGGRNPEDVGECDMLKGKNVEVIHLPFSSHLSHIPFIVDTQNPEQLRQLIDKAHDKNALIEGRLGSEVADLAFSEMSQMQPVPKLKDLVSAEFDALKVHLDKKTKRTKKSAGK